MGATRREIKVVTDDRDGRELPESTKGIRLTYGDRSWTLYLSPRNRQELDQLITEFTKFAEPIKRKRKVLVKTYGHAAKDVRAWAQTQDPPLAQSRGRLSQKAYDAFDEAH